MVLLGYLGVTRESLIYISCPVPSMDGKRPKQKTYEEVIEYDAYFFVHFLKYVLQAPGRKQKICQLVSGILVIHF